ncbi:MAG: nuclease-related domain-containing protein [Sideroxydans sp.]|nr:nuclease-related domain-containing protein [Sideroxydans sp.]
MIRKELDAFNVTDKFSAAGRAAEEKMAFYLKRFFSSSPDIFVLNGIRLEQAEDAAQMDHLILHPYGVIVVESKSVAGKIQIKDDGQWIRWYGKESSGMASPVTQAKLQLGFMRDYLNLAVKPKGVFDSYAFDVMVAISDSGLILWPTTGNLAEVCKADQIAERIETRISELAKQVNAPRPWTAEHLAKIADFLCATHKPLDFSNLGSNASKRHQEAVTKKVAHVEQQVAGIQALMTQSIARMTANMLGSIATRHAQSAEMVTAHVPATSICTEHPVAATAGGICKHCSSAKVSVLYGHSYYLYCHSCSKNTPLKSTCSSCGAPEITRKKSKEFFLECKACNTSRLFHINE